MSRLSRLSYRDCETDSGREYETFVTYWWVHCLGKLLAWHWQVPKEWESHRNREKVSILPYEVYTLLGRRELHVCSCIRWNCREVRMNTYSLTAIKLSPQVFDPLTREASCRFADSLSRCARAHKFILSPWASQIATKLRVLLEHHGLCLSSVKL